MHTLTQEIEFIDDELKKLIVEQFTLSGKSWIRDVVREEIYYSHLDRTFLQNVTSYITVIGENEKILGVGVWFGTQNDMMRPCDLSVFVPGSDRFRGIGKSVVDEVKTVAKCLGYKQIVVDPWNENAKQFYKKCDAKFVQRGTYEIGLIDV